MIEGTGGCADVLAYAWRFFHDPRRSARRFTLSELRDRISDMRLDDETEDHVFDLALATVEEATHVRNFLPFLSSMVIRCYKWLYLINCVVIHRTYKNTYPNTIMLAQWQV